jgi:hypothetical protein
MIEIFSSRVIRERRSSTRVSIGWLGSRYGGVPAGTASLAIEKGRGSAIKIAARRSAFRREDVIGRGKKR